MNQANKKLIKLTLVKSLIGTKKDHRETIKGLGLKKINSISEVEDTPSVRGMIKKVNYLLKFE